MLRQRLRPLLLLGASLVLQHPRPLQAQVIICTWDPSLARSETYDRIRRVARLERAAEGELKQVARTQARLATLQARATPPRHRIAVLRARARQALTTAVAQLEEVRALLDAQALFTNQLGALEECLAREAQVPAGAKPKRIREARRATRTARSVVALRSRIESKTEHGRNRLTGLLASLQEVLNLWGENAPSSDEVLAPDTAEPEASATAERAAR